ncbi:hypothetical protein BTR22_12570 [Alkalihalophilus pseudofirmus]|uniref:type IV pilus modification PilV family protein n=1 Tax=Alkalihalophilus pseudofirmus TaxID=79885 RepID=UPI000952AF9B|nr:hypothetical protein BTR22_12570 [Alkalihalophilus pseudofirmus]
MHRPRFRINNNGLTLIEVLASMVILSIVIISFMTFFSQSMMFSSKVEDRLTAVNLAEKVLVDVRTAKSIELEIHPHYKKVPSNEETDEKAYLYEDLNKKEYIIKVADNIDNEIPHDLKLNLFYVDVYINEKDATRLYGYIEND